MDSKSSSFRRQNKGAEINADGDSAESTSEEVHLSGSYTRVCYNVVQSKRFTTFKVPKVGLEPT